MNESWVKGGKKKEKGNLGESKALRKANSPNNSQMLKEIPENINMPGTMREAASQANFN